MSSITRRSLTRAALLPACAGVLGLAVLLTARADEADDDETGEARVVRVEEDWSLLVREPNPGTASPQVSTQMRSGPDADRVCCLHINATEGATSAPGGLQLQVWQGSHEIAAKPFPGSAVMRTNDELVTWTQYLRRDGDKLLFGLASAASDTWGDFSGLEVAAPRGNRNLNDYSPEDSVRQSGVTYGGNRVASFVLLRTRKYFADGTVQSDATPRVVFSAVLDPQLGTGPEGQP